MCPKSHRPTISPLFNKFNKIQPPPITIARIDNNSNSNRKDVKIVAESFTGFTLASCKLARCHGSLKLI